MSYQAVIEVASRERQIREIASKRAAQRRHDELIALVNAIPERVDRRRREYRDTLPQADELGPCIDWTEWRDWLAERNGKMRKYEMALHIERETGIPCTGRQVSGAMIGLRLITKKSG